MSVREYNTEAERSQSCTMSIRDLGILLHGLYLTFTRRPVTVRRTLFTLFAVGLYMCLRMVVRIGHMVDDLFFPGYRQQTVDSPLYIVTFPRSGTTFLHRLMCLDEEQFTFLKTYQTLFPVVSVLVGLLSALDQKIGGPLSKLVRWLDRRAFTGWQSIHPIGLACAEEDEGIFLYPFWTPVLYLLFPFVDEFDFLQFADRYPRDVRHRVMSFYRRCIQRHLYAAGRGRALLSKNVHSTGRIESILQVFPDARFVFIIRSPHEAIPSLLSLYYAVWEAHSPDIPRDSPEVHALARMGYGFYRHLKDVCQQLPEEQYICLSFEELVQDPERVIEHIYEHINLPMSEAFRARVRQAVLENQSYRSTNHYSLEEYGLSEAEISEELADVFEFARQRRAAVADSALLS
jgi:hypothetical protein